MCMHGCNYNLNVFFAIFGLYWIKTHPKHVSTLPRISGFHLNPSYSKTHPIANPKHLQVQKWIETKYQSKTRKWEKFEKHANPRRAFYERWSFLALGAIREDEGVWEERRFLILKGMKKWKREVEVFVWRGGSWSVREKMKRFLNEEDEENNNKKMKRLVIVDKMKRQERHLMAKLCVV